jgi:hypothetical protein
MRTRKQRRTRKRSGGKRLGRGVSGIVYTPVLQCDNNSHTDFSGLAYVSKAVPGHKVESELANADAVRALDPTGDYTIVPLHHCALAGAQTNANFLRNKNNSNNTYENNEERLGQRKIYTHQVIYRNGGKSLQWWFSQPKHIGKIIRALKVFIPKLVEFNKSYMHFDLHLDNLVFDGEKIRIIDFEKMGPMRPEIQNADLCNILMSVYHSIKRRSDAETFGGWLTRYEQVAKYPYCAAHASVDDLVACFNAMPDCNSKGCSIMG